MSKLLPRALVKYENAENSYKKIEENDAYIDDCCYNLQQCIELLLKYAVEMSGQPFVENHDVRAQLNKLSDKDISIPLSDKLRAMAVTLNSWEAESRYLDSFIATIEDIEEARTIAKELIKYCKTLVVETDIEEVIT